MNNSRKGLKQNPTLPAALLSPGAFRQCLLRTKDLEVTVRLVFKVLGDFVIPGGTIST